jgi:hypothetical protein
VTSVPKEKNVIGNEENPPPNLGILVYRDLTDHSFITNFGPHKYSVHQTKIKNRNQMAPNDGENHDPDCVRKNKKRSKI